METTYGHRKEIGNETITAIPTVLPHSLIFPSVIIYNNNFH